MACLQIYRELLSLATFLRVHSNSKEVSYLPWQNTYPNLKTTCHIKLKCFLWTKLIENLLLGKYLISVTPPLMSLWLKKMLVSSANIIQLNKRGALGRLLTYTTNRSGPRIDPRETTQVTNLRFALLFSSISMYFFLLDQ